jgi:PIN domain nuclease of toxin-antitoxin system
MKSALKDEPTVVLDACALIAFFNDEPGADIVAEVLHVVPVVEMAAINLLEIAFRNGWMDGAQLQSAIAALGKTPYAEYLRTLA